MQTSTGPDLIAIGLALALGLLIGVQRGWASRSSVPGSRFAGVRTYGLLGLAGGIAGSLQARAEGLATVLLAASAVLVLLGYWRSTKGRASISGTSSLTGLITLAAGFLAGSGDYALASALAGTTVLVLAQRNRWHHWLRHIDEQEMHAIARFALIALVILQLLPDTPFGPYGAWRPRQLWLVVVLVSGFSFAGYAGVKLLGPARGILATAAAGSMVSSTAVTAALAGKLRDGAGDPRLHNAGVALASATMFLRVTLLTAALAPFALAGFAILALPAMQNGERQRTPLVCLALYQEQAVERSVAQPSSKAGLGRVGSVELVPRDLCSLLSRQIHHQKVRLWWSVGKSGRIDRH